jgi:hypothetical protein
MCRGDSLGRVDLTDRQGMMGRAATLLENTLARVDTAVERERVTEAAGVAIADALGQAGPGIAHALRDGTKAMLRDHRNVRRRFERTLREVWGKALDAYYAVYVVALEAGEQFNNEQREAAAVENDFVFECLTSLHARCCLAASEIYALLRTGHASGQWRDGG